GGCCLSVLLFFSSSGGHPRSKRDWSSDVCSSDLSAAAVITLRDEGCAVDGATMVLHPFAAREAEDARRTAQALGVGFYQFDWQADRKSAVEGTRAEDRGGRTSRRERTGRVLSTEH